MGMIVGFHKLCYTDKVLFLFMGISSNLVFIVTYILAFTIGLKSLNVVIIDVIWKG